MATFHPRDPDTGQFLPEPGKPGSRHRKKGSASRKARTALKKKKISGTVQQLKGALHNSGEATHRVSGKRMQMKWATGMNAPGGVKNVSLFISEDAHRGVKRFITQTQTPRNQKGTFTTGKGISKGLKSIGATESKAGDVARMIKRQKNNAVGMPPHRLVSKTAQKTAAISAKKKSSMASRMKRTR